VLVGLLLLLELRAGAEESVADPRTEAITALRRGRLGLPRGAFGFRNRYSESALPTEYGAEGIRRHLERCLRRSFQSYFRKSPTEDEEREIREELDETLAMSEFASLAPLEELEEFRLIVGDTWAEFSRDMRIESPPGWEDPTGRLLVQYREDEFIHRLSIGHRKDGAAVTNIDVKRHLLGASAIELTAPTRYWTYAWRVVDGLVESFESAGSRWVWRSEGKMLVAEWVTTEPIAEWPGEVPFYRAAPFGGTMTVTIDGGNAILSRMTVRDSLGEFVEELVLERAVADGKGSIALSMSHKTWYPGLQRTLRTSEVFEGRVEKLRDRVPMDVLIPPGATVTDFRVSPPVTYVQPVVPVPDRNIIAASAEGAHEDASARTDPAVISSRESTASPEPGGEETVPRQRMVPGIVLRWLAAGLAVAALALFLVRRRGAAGPG
jgi:hypothetical protein